MFPLQNLADKELRRAAPVTLWVFLKLVYVLLWPLQQTHCQGPPTHLPGVRDLMGGTHMAEGNDTP